MERFDVLNAYDRRRALDKKRGKADKVIEDAFLRDLCKEVLRSGDSSGLTVAEKLVVETVQEAIDNPTTSKLKDLMAISGEPLAPTEIKTSSTISVNSELEKEALGETKWEALWVSQCSYAEFLR